ncbi:hypothetical protein BDR26DRAFT_802538, partial [Obelidium mucronatum]
QAINVSRPFGLKLWKPALYKKERSINALTESAIHEDPDDPSQKPISRFFHPGNLIWLIFFGWWVSIVYLGVAMILFPFGALGFLGLHSLSLATGWYMFWPFGKFIIKKRRPTRHFIAVPIASPVQIVGDGDADSVHTSASAAEGHSSDGTEVPQCRVSSRSRGTRPSAPVTPPTPFTLKSVLEIAKDVWGKIRESGPAGFFFRLLAFLVLGPVHLVVCVICYLGVFSLPMARLSYAVFSRLTKRRPLAVRACWGESRKAFGLTGRGENATVSTNKEFKIILCTNHAFGSRYYKFTIDGINIIILNLNAVVVFTLVNFYFIGPMTDHSGIGSYGVTFLSALLSVIPLAYMIGMAVSSITAQTGSLALGAVVNATFGSIVEILLYCLALMQGKTKMVEGSIIGSFMAGLLALPGVSMFFGGLMRKEQKFNAKAAGVTSTLLIMAILGAFGPTFFQGVYGTFELQCVDCPTGSDFPRNPLNCRQCRNHQPHPTEDPIYIGHTRPLMYICATVLILMYAIGLLFTLRTHSKNIYPTEPKKKRKGGHHGSGDAGGHGGHDHPNWSAKKSTAVLLLATLFFSLIAEVLIDCVDNVIDTEGGGHDGKWVVDEKILGLTLFALVPTVTEFYNAIAFARQGNIALSLEIGSAYTIQVALLQIPTLVAFSTFWRKQLNLIFLVNNLFLKDTFTLVFPRWDVISVLFGVFTVTYLYIEGKSNYFKGAMLLLAYGVLMTAFGYAPPELSMDS